MMLGGSGASAARSCLDSGSHRGRSILQPKKRFRRFPGTGVGWLAVILCGANSRRNLRCRDQTHDRAVVPGLHRRQPEPCGKGVLRCGLAYSATGAR